MWGTCSVNGIAGKFWNSVWVCEKGDFLSCCRHYWDLVFSLTLNTVATGGKT